MAVDIEILKTLCDFNGHEYESKKGHDYLDALRKVFSLDNTNDNPFTIEDILLQPELCEFSFSGLEEYKYICKLKVQPMIITSSNKRINERIFPEDFDSEDAKKVFYQSLGVSYLLTCPYQGKEYIIKIGSSRTTFEKRLGSYNCGVVNNWRTASTTNIKILQSMVTNRATLNLYLVDCSHDPYILKWHGVESVPFASPKALAIEDIMIKQFISQFGKKPLANIQASATEVG
ncbi:hypothetical protein IKE87_00775 [Candidatus Saccharibacteria bacterium]|nr:hypothetical protein [Candidatus Saccharibacteria bacterium]